MADTIPLVHRKGDLWFVPATVVDVPGVVLKVVSSIIVVKCRDEDGDDDDDDDIISTEAILIGFVSVLDSDDQF